MNRVHLVTTCFTLWCSAVFAEPLVMTYESVGSGTLDNQAFENLAFSITAHADTDDVEDRGFRRVLHESATISLEGLGEFELEFPSQTFLVGDVVGLQPQREWPGGSGDLLYIRSPELTGWELSTPIGPVSSDSGQLLQWDGNGSFAGQVEFPTSGGVLFFEDAENIPSSFTATVPEPHAEGNILLAVAVFVLARFPRHSRV